MQNLSSLKGRQKQTSRVGGGGDRTDRTDSGHTGAALGILLQGVTDMSGLYKDLSDWTPVALSPEAFYIPKGRSSCHPSPVDTGWVLRGLSRSEL